MAEIERHLWRSSSPRSAWSSRTMSSLLLRISKDGDPSTSLGNLCNFLTILEEKKASLSLDFVGFFFFLNLCFIASGSVSKHD